MHPADTIPRRLPHPKIAHVAILGWAEKNAESIVEERRFSAA
jgi:hypothetical protein